jgi:5-methylcytosine-specific restriction protein A
MAKRIKKACSFPGCPKLTVAKHGYCPEHKTKVDSSYQKERTVHKLYYTKRWDNLRKMVLNSQPFCADPHNHHNRYQEGRMVATEVDHVDGNVNNNFWEIGHPDNNLQGLCKACHSRKTAREQHRWGEKGKVYKAPYSRPE